MAGRRTNAELDYLKAQGGELYAKGFSIQTIVEMTGVTPKTAYKWREECDWEHLKELHNLRPSEIKKMILDYVVALKNGEPLPYKADDLSKVAAAWDKIDDKRKRAVYTMETFSGFSSFLIDRAATAKGKKRQERLDQLKDLRVLMDEFVNMVLGDKD